MIQFGNDKIKEIYHGSDKIKEIYYGSELVWSGSKPSYMILTDDTRIDFEIENTEIAIFCSSLSTMRINGVSYGKSLIKEIHFGSSYSGVTEMGIRFLQNCISLTDVTLNFPALNSVGNYFLAGCTSLTDVTLDFPALNSVGTFFLAGCTSLTDVTLTAETPPIAGSSYFLHSTSKLLSIYVPPVSVQAYKTTSPWSNKSSLIKAMPNYMILTDGRRIGFEIENTPIANFCTTDSSMVINGVSYTKSTIKEIHFGDSYSGVTEIGDYFLQNCSSLTDLTLNFPVLSSIGNYFISDCTFLTNVTLTAETPPNTSSRFFLYNTIFLSSIYVPANSVNLYKTTEPWSSKSSLIKAI